jgi:two-component sensor histidine kinase
MNVYVLLSFVSFVLFTQGVLFAFYQLGPSRERTAFVSSLAATAIYALFTFLANLTDDIEAVYVYDRFASIGWATFPAFVVWLIYVVSKSESRPLKALIAFLLVPLALTSLIRYNYDPHSIKFYNLNDGIWYFSVSQEGPWFYLFVFYLFMCVAISMTILHSVWIKAISKRQRKQLVSIGLGLLTFAFAGLVTNLTFPFIGVHIVPPLAHINILFLGLGFFYAVVIYRQPSFTSEVVSQFTYRHVQDYVFYFDKRGTLFSVNKYCIDQLKYNSYEILRIQPDKLFGDFNTIQRLILEFQTKSKPAEVHMDLFPRNSPTIPVKFAALRINDSYGVFLGMILIGFDQRLNLQLKQEIIERIRNERRLKRTTLNLEALVEKRTSQLQAANEQLQLEIMEKARAEEQISIDLKEKLILLKEIHHRVKNNFQIVISLARMLESHEAMNEHDRQRIRLISEKIRWISSIHEYFYSIQKLSKINFSDFLKKATGDLYANLGSGDRILFRLNVGEVLLGIDQALPCGIIFHELLSNAIRHAFNTDNSANLYNPNLSMIVVEFFDRKNQYVLIVSDNGVGLPGFSHLKRKGYSGIKLAKLLGIRHLSGKLTVVKDSGTTCKLTFPKPQSPATA